MEDMLDAGYTMTENEEMIQVKDLSIEFRVKDKTGQRVSLRGRYKTALDSVSFSVMKGDTFGITGETGSGKSTLGKILLGVYKPTGGSVTVLGRKIKFSSRKDVRFVRENTGIVFQDPVGSLNPRLTVYDIIKEGLINAREIEKSEYDDRIARIAKVVGLRESKMDLYPRSISGGEKQRVSIARTLVAPKKIVVLDEPTSSLDVSIQGQILNLLKDIKEELNLTYIFITHDIDVMKYMSNKLAILYYAKLVEIGNTKSVIGDPQHPYTKRLITNSAELSEEGPSEFLYDDSPEAAGCIFRKSCPSAMEVCDQEPPVTSIDESHKVNCWLYSKNQ